MKVKIISAIITLSMLFCYNVLSPAGVVTIWDFELYNKPYTEQIALSIIQTQKSLGEETKSYLNQDPMEMFKDMITRQILSRLAQMVINDAFGEGGLQPGQYTIGNYTIDISTDEVFITVVITDTQTGNITTIQVPYYNYTSIQ
ncbi:MAG: curli assembly protein CsgF [bacterium]